MENSFLPHQFIQEWIEAKKGNDEHNHAIIDAIEKSLGGIQNEELDESKLLKLLLEITHEEVENG